eukprot:13940504-Alexandrium_andersonii.AAC.1
MKSAPSACAGATPFPAQWAKALGGDANPWQRRSSASEACRRTPLEREDDPVHVLSLIHISEPTRLALI